MPAKKGSKGTKKPAVKKTAAKKSRVPKTLDARDEVSVAQQLEIQGMETETIPSLEAAAHELGGYLDRVKSLNVKVKEGKTNCLTLMRAHEITSYHKHGVHLDIDDLLKIALE